MKTSLLPFRHAARAAYFRTLGTPAALSLIARHYSRAGKAFVLSLHNVSAHPRTIDPPLDPRLFEQLVDFLVRHTSVVPVDALSEPQRASSDRPRVVLSFDDGHSDLMDYAVPILTKYGLRANVNVIGQCIESQTPPWMWRLYDLLEHAPDHLIRRLDLPGLCAIERFESRRRTAQVLSAFLKARSTADRALAIACIEEQLSSVEVTHPRRHLAEAELVELARGHDIGMHSHSHASMRYESDDFFVDDFNRCAATITSCIGRRPTIYAFPNGSFRQSHIEMLRQNNIAHIMLTGEQPTTTDGGVYTRIGLYGQNNAELRTRAMGGLAFSNRFRGTAISGAA